MCNEKIQEDQIIEWRAKIVSYGLERINFFSPSPEFIVEILRQTTTDFSNVHFVPGDEHLTRSCGTAFDIVTCNQTGLWKVFDESMETLCLDGYPLPVIDKIDEHRFGTFKNIACLHCNTRRDLNIERLSCPYWEIRPELARRTRQFSAALNLRSLVSDGPSRKPLELAPYIETDTFIQLPYRRCSTGKIYLQVSYELFSYPSDRHANYINRKVIVSNG